jgi:phage tail-like protein
MKSDPYKNFRFLLEIDGINQAGFSECTGLGSNVEVVEYREGGDPTTVRKLRGKITVNDIVLKWGITDSHEVYDWHKDIVAGKPLDKLRKNGSIVLLDDLGDEKIRWNFFAAWPTKWEGPKFVASANEIAIETLTISCERVERAK